MSASRRAAATRFRQSSRCSESAFDDTPALYPVLSKSEPSGRRAAGRLSAQDGFGGVVGREEQLDGQLVERDVAWRAERGQRREQRELRPTDQQPTRYEQLRLERFRLRPVQQFGDVRVG